MKEPEIDVGNDNNLSTDSTNKPQNPKRSLLKKLLYAIVIICVFIGVGYYILRFKYSDEYFRALAQDEISKAINGECVIGSVNLSLFGNVQINDVSVSTAAGVNTSQKQFLKVKKIFAQLNVIKSIMSLQPNISLVIDNTDIDIERIPVTDKVASIEAGMGTPVASSVAPQEADDEFSTNVHDSIRSIVSISWKKWLGDFNWKIVAADVKINNVRVLIHDQEKKLGDCSFAVDFAGELSKSGVLANVIILQSTPDIKNGRIELNSDIVFDWEAAKQRADKTLAFIGSLNFNLMFDNLDLGYIGRYYIQDPDQLARLGSPFSGKIVFTAEDISQVQMDVDFVAEKAVVFVRDNKKVEGGDPSLRFTAKGEADLSHEWSQLKNINLNITSLNTQTKQQLFNLSSNISGSFGDEIVVALQSKADMGGVTGSVIGKLLKLDNVAQGGVILGVDFTWKKKADWEYRVDFKSVDLVLQNKGVTTPAPLDLVATGNIKPIDEFVPESISTQLKLTSPGIEVVTPAKIVVPVAAGQSIPMGEVNISINIPKVFSVFDKPLKVLGIGKIDEILEAQVKVLDNKQVNLVAVMKNTEKKYLPCNITGSFTLKGKQEFLSKLQVVAENKAVQMLLDANGSTTNNKTVINFTNQIALRTEAGLKLLKRVSGLVPDMHVAQFPVNGVVQGGVSGKVVADKGVTSLAVANSFTINDLAFTTDEGKKFIEKKATLEMALSMQDVSGKKKLKLEKFDWKSNSLTASAKVADLSLGELASTPAVAIGKMKGAEVGINLSELAFTNLDALLGADIPSWVSSGKSLKLALNSEDNGGVKVKTLEFSSAGVAANIKDLRVNLLETIAAVDSKNYKDIFAKISPFSIDINTNNIFWSGVDLPKGLQFRGQAAATINYIPEFERLNIKKIVLVGDKTNKAFVSRMSMATVVDGLGKLIENPNLQQIIASLPNGVNVPVLTVSIPLLNNFLASKRNGESTMPLNGENIEVKNLRLTRTKRQDTVQITGTIGSRNLGFDDILRFDGDVALNNLLVLNNDNVEVTGEVKLDSSAINLKAVPYVYNKSMGQAARMYYKLSVNNSGAVNVMQAGIIGGPLEFALSKLQYQPKKNDTFALTLPIFKLTAPFVLNISNVKLDPDNDIITANIASSGIDLNKMAGSLNTGLPSTLGGAIGGFNVVVADRYSTILGKKEQKFSADNKFMFNPSKILLTSADSAQPISMMLSIGKIGGDSGTGKFFVDGVAITSPTGFSEQTPIRIGRIESKLDMGSLRGKTVIVDEVIVDSFNAVYEMKFPKNNIKVLEGNINALLPEPASNTMAGSSAKSIQKKSSINTVEKQSETNGGILIKNLYLNNGVVDLRTEILKTKLDIPPSHVKDIGGNNPRVAFTTILQVLLKSTGTAAVSLLNNGTGTAVKSVTNLIGSALKQVNKQTEDSEQQDSSDSDINKQIDQGLKSLGNLFK